MEQGTFYLVAGLSAPPLVERNQYKMEKVELRKMAKNHNNKVMEYIENTAFEGDVKISVISLEEFEDNPNRLGMVRKRRVLPKVIVPDKVKIEKSGGWINSLHNGLYLVPEKVEVKNTEDAINNAFHDLSKGWDNLDDIPFPVEEEEVYGIYPEKAGALLKKTDALLAKIDDVLFPVGGGENEVTMYGVLPKVKK